MTSELTEKEREDLMKTITYGKQTFQVGPTSGYNGSVIVCSTITGCGLVQLSGLTSIVRTSTPERWKEVAEEIRKKFHVNTIIAASGDGWPEVVEEIESFGWKKVAQHINIVHGTSYLQYIYMYIIDEKYKPKDGWGIPTEIEEEELVAA